MIHVGYTDDGRVVLTVLSTADGKPIKTEIMLTSESAETVADGIHRAAHEARKVSDERNRAYVN